MTGWVGNRSEESHHTLFSVLMDFFYVFEQSSVILENCLLRDVRGNKPAMLPQVPMVSSRRYLGVSAM